MKQASILPTVKHCLIIVAHPSSAGYSHQVADSYFKKAVEKGYEVKIIDLFNDSNAEHFLRFQEKTQIPTITEGNYFRELLTWADEYIFCFPIWWYDAPAIFKNFFDLSFISGFAYVYESHLPQGLLGQKVVKIYATSDGPAVLYYLRILPFISAWKARLKYCGIQKIKIHILGQKRWQKIEYCEKWIQNKVIANV